MKTRTVFLASILILSASNMIKAQEYKIPAENSKEGMLSLDGFSGDLTIEGYSGSDIIFSSANKEYEVPERAKGLKPVYSGGTDNTGIGLSVEKDGNQVKVTCLLPFTKSGEYTIKVPENMSVKVQSQCQNSNNVIIQKMKNEIEIQNCYAINLKDVSGPLVLSTISGDIDITFGTISTDKPFSINAISGNIDITLPPKIAADIEMGSVTGTMYSDFDFSDSSKDMKRVGGNQLNYKLNGGGIRFRLATISGNIYLRKGK
jgi:lia operon protein LiaG